MNLSMLIALTQGISGVCDPLKDIDFTEDFFFDDLTNPLNNSSRVNIKDLSIEGNDISKEIEKKAVILWDNRHTDLKYNYLEVPSTSFIAGECDSAFDIAWKLVDSNLLDTWGFVITTSQRQGRGQLRRPWYSPRGNIHAVFRLPKDPLIIGDAASIITGFILTTALCSLGFNVALKWPNDILDKNNNKVGGVLLEEKKNVVLAGVGINLLKTPPLEELRSPESLPAGILSLDKDKVQNNIPLAPFPLFQAIVSNSVVAYNSLIKGCLLEDVLKKIESVLVWKGKRILINESNGASSTGLCVGLGKNGGLLIKKNNGIFQEITSGSILLD